MQAIALLLSYIFHPIFIPFYATFFLVWCNPYMFGQIPSYDSVFVLRTVLLYSIFFPLFTVFLMKRLDFISDYEVQDKRERVLVYMITSSYFLWTFFVMWREGFREEITDVMLGATIALTLGFVITTISEKVSAHTIGMGGLFAVVLFATNIARKDITSVIFATIILAGLIGTCRLLLNAHTPREVYNGYMIGFLCMALALLF